MMTYGNLIPMWQWLVVIKRRLAVFVLLVLFSCSAEQNHPVAIANSEPAYKVFVVEKNNDKNSWGYIVEYRHKLIIKQFSIPALEGEQPFKNKEQATLVGDLVTKKLNMSMRPAITKTELDSLGITQPIHAVQKK